MNIQDLTLYEINKIKEFGNLKPEELEFFDLRNDCKTYEEIAEIMDISVDKVKKTLSKKVYSKCIRVLLND